MIIFEKLTCKNFCAVGNQPLTVYFENTDNTLIIGTNGAGKTSATIESLVYCLFNKPYRKKVTLAGLINTTNKNNSEVNVYFRTGANKYRVRRGQKPSIFEIYKNDELIEPPASKSDYQSLLENDILGMDFRVFSQVVVLNKSRFTPFMDLPAADRRYIVEEFLDINIISKMMKVVKDRMKSLKNEIYNKDNEHELLAKDIDKLQSLIELAESNTTDSQRKLLDQIKSHKDFINDQNVCIHADKATIKEIVSEVKILIGDRKLKDERFEIQSKISKLNTDKGINQNELKRHKTDAMFFNSNHNCPQCTQTISEEFSKQCIQQIKDKAIEVSKIISDIDTMLEDHNKQLADIDQLILKVNESESKCKDLQNNINANLRIIDSTQRTIDAIEKQLQEENSEVLSIDAEKVELGILITQETELNDYRGELNQRMDDLRTVEDMLREDGVKADIIKQYIPIINTKVNEYLGHMNLNINFMLDEEFNEKILLPGKENFIYYNFSDGQRTRIDLALLLTWINIAKDKNSVNTNLLILDEILEALDINGIHDFLRTVKYTFEGVNFFVISQRKEEICDCFKNQLEFDLVNGFTQIVTE